MQIETKEQEMIINALKNGTLACLPGPDGFADTQPVVNIVSGNFYHGANILCLKEHQKQNGFPTAEYLSEKQLYDVYDYVDPAELSIGFGEKGFSVNFDNFNEKTEKWESNSVVLFNIEQTTNPEAIKAYAKHRQQEYINSRKKNDPSWEPQPQAPGPVIVCTSTDPEKYLGQYFAAVSLNGKFKASPEQSLDFSQKLEREYFNKDITMEYARDVIREFKQQQNFEDEYQKAEHELIKKAGYVQGVCECVAAISDGYAFGKKLLSEMNVTKDMAKKFANPETYKALEQGIFAPRHEQKQEQTHNIRR